MGGGSSAPTSSGSGSTTSNPVLYNWQQILPPWTRAGQEAAVPWLMARASQGLLPSEERNLWGQMKGQIDTSSDLASRNLSRQIAASGMSTTSPMVAGAYSDLAADRMSTTSKAALDFAKMKLGEKDTAIGQMLTALYTPPPVAVGQQSYGTQTTKSGGGK